MIKWQDLITQMGDGEEVTFRCNRFGVCRLIKDPNLFTFESKNLKFYFQRCYECRGDYYFYREGEFVVSLKLDEKVELLNPPV